MFPTHPDLVAGDLSLARETVAAFRVGFRPDPFLWTPWQYAERGRFDGRWDDSNGQFRTIYVADSLLGCLLEVLSRFRPDPRLAAELAAIDVAEGDDEDFPTAPAGQVPTSWLQPRCAGTAQLTGNFVDVRAPATVQQIRHHLGAVAGTFGVPDVDAASLKQASSRTFTQHVAAWTYQLAGTPTGIRFGSRHGDEFTLWALFERPEDGHGSNALTDHTPYPLEANTSALVTAFTLFGLSWS